MKNIFFILLTILVLSSCASAKEANAGAEPEVQDTVEIIGRVAVFGNEPFTYAGIVAEDGKQYAIYPQEKEMELRAFQTTQMRFTVIFMEEEKVYGSMYLKGGTVKPLKWEILR